ncbi:Membrane protein involved in the export of O-antigen and teichoic acid [Sphingomonas laterariae]|uniref:Membrane protein involved in the export of O-antigen and teichoic acid n=2 Tax=Edaphosphingomonas laterariae TaxID=861865 RepID=A0A239JW94_9SPHN|nr:Membrane protein involved in the export of O-antigen and teichoic acid [Sphingomonas laterariae]
MLVPIGAGLLALPVIFHNVGQQVFTLFLLSYGAINFAPNLDLGVARTAQRRIAYSVKFHTGTRMALVRHSLKLAALVSVGMALAAMIGAAILFPSQGNPTSRLGLAVVTGFGVALAIYANCQRGVLEGLGAFSRSALNRAGVGIMLVAAPLLISFLVREATVLSLAALMIRLPFIWEQQRAIHAALKRKAAGERHEDVLGGFMRESAWFAFLSVLAVAMSGFDRYILIAWASLAGDQLAIFLATQDIALRAIAVPTALLPALTVRLAAGGDPASMRILSRRLFLAVVPAVLLGCIGATLLSRQIGHILYPQLPAADTVATLRTLLFGIAASAIAQFPMARLVAAGHVRDAALMHLGEFAIYIAVAPPLIAHFGALGAAALWSGRIIIDTAALIVWSGVRQGERASMIWEGVALAGTIVLIALIGAAG